MGANDSRPQQISAVVGELTPEHLNIDVSVDGDGFVVILRTGAGGDATMWQQAGHVEGLAGLECILVDH